MYQQAFFLLLLKSAFCTIFYVHSWSTTSTISPFVIDTKRIMRPLEAATSDIVSALGYDTDIDESFAHAQFFMPSIIERALIHQETDGVDPLELLHRVDMSPLHRKKALEYLESRDSVLTVPTLTQSECQTLRAFINAQMKNDGCIDDTDGCPDYQININHNKLEKLVGSDTVQKLLSIPQQLEEGGTQSTFERVGIFLRMYRRDKRPWMPFHIDSNRWTVNVALNSDEEFEHGKLLALHKGKVERIERNEGDATYHRGGVVHGVSAIGEGTRYSMILFLHTTD